MNSNAQLRLSSFGLNTWNVVTKLHYLSLVLSGVLAVSIVSSTRADLIGQWTFEDGSLVDSMGNFPDLELKGDATVVNGQLDVNGDGTNATGWAVTGGNYSGPEITDKTLVSWLTLESLDDVAKAGSVITLDRTSSDQFDGIIFAERETNRWMAGSSFFRRTMDFVPGFEETTTAQEIMMAITYQHTVGGIQVSGYHNGLLIGQYDSEFASSWPDGDGEVFFGKRHGSKDSGPGGLDALIQEARIYNEVLSQEAIEAIRILDPPEHPGDYNLDETVDLADFEIMVANFNTKFPVQESFGKGDFNLDTRIDLKDFMAFREVFNAQPGAGASVPEPSTCALLGVAACMLLVRGRQTSFAGNSR